MGVYANINIQKWPFVSRGFKAVNMLLANISCEIEYNYVKTKAKLESLKTCLQPCAGDPC